MTEYHKIETLYERDEKTHRLVEPLVLKNRVYGCLKSWQFTEKIDGTNIRVIWDGERVTFGGRTDNAQIPADLVNWLSENVKAEALAATFHALEPGSTAVLYGEGYGAGIQKGGGDYSPVKKFILFDVRVGTWWLSDENMRDVANNLGLRAVPSFGEMTLEDATAMVRGGIASQIGIAGKQAEGLVGRPVEALFDKKGHRLIVKLKTHDFAQTKERPGQSD